MTKSFLIYGIVGTFLIHSPASAIIKCFKTAPYQMDDSYLHSSYNSYWGLEMGDTTVEGVALCTKNDSQMYATGNTYCQCIATTPFISEWFRPDGYYDDQGNWQYTQGYFETQSDCEDQCAYYCSETYNIFEYGDQLPSPADGTTHSQCPSGFLAITYDNLTLANSSCPTGTYAIGTITACSDIGTDEQECGLFMPAGTHTDETGTYEYSEPCPWTD
ncbi:MAG: hypothetical protein IJX89_03155 [Alphaproteobacteria bacterium]|nr:hypothetical protein [Alphaproteobacteria bacterium]